MDQLRALVSIVINMVKCAYKEIAILATAGGSRAMLISEFKFQNVVSY